MSRQRKVLLVSFIVVSVIGMVARHYNQQAERRRMERTLETLARIQREQRLQAEAAALPTPAPTVEETRDMFASERPREFLEAVRQAAGQDFKLMELRFSDDMATALLSTDGKSAQKYFLYRGRKNLEGPSPVNLIGGGSLADGLYEQKAVDLDLIPRLAQEAPARAGIEGARVTSVTFSYESIRYKGESPVWTVMVERGQAPPDWEHKLVKFDAKGKFKSAF